MGDLASTTDDLRLPLICAPMTAVSNPAMAAAACAAGIVGSFPTSNAPSATALDEWFDEVDQRVRDLREPAPSPVLSWRTSSFIPSATSAWTAISTQSCAIE